MWTLLREHLQTVGTLPLVIYVTPPSQQRQQTAEIEKQRQMSVCKIERSETYDMGKPKMGALSDPGLGTIERHTKCETCAGSMAECPRHFGHLELAKPMFHIGFLKTVLSILRCVCYNCSRVLAYEDDHRFKQAKKVRNPKHRLKKVLDCCKSKTNCDAGDDIDENDTSYGD